MHVVPLSSGFFFFLLFSTVQTNTEEIGVVCFNDGTEAFPTILTRCMRSSPGMFFV